MKINRQTINAIAQLLSLFTEQEKEGLKIVLGTQEITLEQQFLARWHNHKPRYSGAIFLYKAAHILNGNKALFIRAIEFNTVEFQERLRTIISSPESYINIKTIQTNNRDILKNLSTSQGQSTALARGLNKIRSGSTESGQEYIDIENLWEKEDVTLLQKGLSKQSLKANINIDPTKKGVERLNIDLEAQDAEQPATYFESTKPDLNLENYEPTLQSINVNQTRSQGLTQSNTNSFNFQNQHKELDGLQTTKDMATIEALQLMTATKIKDPRETAFQKLDVLFWSCL